jgi:hypothetical protein
VCTDKQKPGFSWDDLDFGDFFDYKDFNFKGWKCEDDGERRGRFAPRTGRKVIGGVCSSDKKQSPSFGCGASVDKFSLGSIHVKPEFDCDLEFHYDMPDGSSCKHRSPCRKSGTTIVNRQCGGAKNVTIIYPPQPNKPKPSCSIQVPTISFDCETASSTKPPKTKPVTTTTPPVVETTPATSEVEEPSSTPPVETTPATSEVEEPSSTAPGELSSTPPAETSTKVVPGDSTTNTDVEVTSTVAPGELSSTPPAETSTKVVPGDSTTNTDVEATSTVAPGQESSTRVAEEPSSSVPPVTKTITTSYDSTSTIFSTSTQTITQCEPTVTDCPGDSVTTTVVTIAVSTTICPVTETLTTIESTVEIPAESTAEIPAESTAEIPAESTAESPAESTVEGTPAPTLATSTVAAGTSDAVTSAKPVETLPCPGVVPSCLNTFLFDLGCADNTDAECYCPEATFVKNVYDCLYAHGETDAIISEAVAYFQGICGKWAGENPAIATGATITTYITVTATPTVAPVYTTVFVDVTTVVPCTDEAGEIIPSSSTTITVSTSMAVPQVDFTTGPAGGVEIIPAPTNSLIPITSSGPTPIVSANETTVGVPTGTASLFPTKSIVTAGVGRVGASFGLAAAVAFVAAVAL